MATSSSVLSVLIAQRIAMVVIPPRSAWRSVRAARSSSGAISASARRTTSPVSLRWPRSTTSCRSAASSMSSRGASSSALRSSSVRGRGRCHRPASASRDSSARCSALVHSSRYPLGLLGGVWCHLCQQEIGGLLGMAGGGENRLFVVFEHLEPRSDISNVILTHVWSDPQFGA